MSVPDVAMWRIIATVLGAGSIFWVLALAPRRLLTPKKRPLAGILRFGNTTSQDASNGRPGAPGGQ